MYEITRLPSSIDIGYVGEKLFRIIEIDMTKWMEQMPDGVPSIVHIRPGETSENAYIASTIFEDNILRWVVTTGDLGNKEGSGVAQVWLEENENASVVKRGKSARFATQVHDSVNDPSSEVPAAQTAWLEQMTSLKTQTVSAKNAAEVAKDQAVRANAQANDSKLAAAESAAAAAGAAADAIAAKETAVAAKDAAVDARDDATNAMDRAQDAISHQPRINQTTGKWQVWNPNTGSYEDTTTPATYNYSAIPHLTVGTVQGADPTADPEITLTGPDSAPVMNFKIPRGASGANDIDDTAGVGDTDLVWSADKTANELFHKAPAIIAEDNSYSHVNVDTVTLVGNAYAFGNARYADKKDYIKGYDRTITSGPITIEAHGNIVVLNGTATSANDVSLWTDENADIPAGEYTFKIEPYGGDSLTNGKKMRLRLWYDGNVSTTWDKEVALDAVKDSVKYSTFTLTNHVWKIIVITGYNTNTYSGYRMFYSLFPSNVTITDVGEAVGPNQTKVLVLPDEMAVIDTMMHKSLVETVVDTKTYIDNHNQEVEFVYFRPEDYGAVGDGSTNDYAALQACINAAQAVSDNKAHAIRGYGTYKIATGIVFNCRELDVFINKIIYTGSDAAVTISASFSKFAFGSIRANTGGSDAVGIRCYQAASGGYQNTFYCNELRCAYVRSTGNTLEFTKAVSVTGDSTMMYNVFHFLYQMSENANIINVSTIGCNENTFYGKDVSAPGYLVHFDEGVIGGIRLINYCLESALSNGSNGYVRYIHCRFAEMMGLQSSSVTDKGFVYRWEDRVPQGYISDPQGGLLLTAFDVSDAYSWSDALARIKEMYEAGVSSEEIPWVKTLPCLAMGFPRFTEIYPVSNVANANMTGQEHDVRNIPDGKLIVYYNNIAYKPDSEIYQKVASDLTILLSSSNNWNYFTPTVFDIDGAAVTIRLDASYCCLAIDEFDVIQHTGKTAIVIDKLGNTIFDGTNLGAGVFHFKCSFVPCEYGTVYITMDNSTVKRCPAGLIKSLYTGENEQWRVTKETLIDPPA